MKFLRLALHSASFQYVPDSSGYASTDLPGPSWFSFFPCGFQNKACFVMLKGRFVKMCPIQSHFLCLVCISVVFCRVLWCCARLYILRMGLKCLFGKVCILLVAAFAVLHVSAP